MRTGYRLAIGVAAVTIVLGIVLFVAEAARTTRDASRYGQVPLPGRESVNLPAGEVLIYYGERPGIDPDPSLRVPPNLRLQVRTTNGQVLLGSTPFSSGQFDDGYERRAVAKLRVPEAGEYEAVSSTRVSGAVDPVLSFGREGTRNFGYVLFVLAGGGLLATILGVGTGLVARAERS